MFDFFHHLLHQFSEISIIFLEFIGIIIILLGTFKALRLLRKENFDLTDPSVRIEIGEALSLALQFLVGAEIIKTIVAQSLEDVLLLVLLVVIRVALAVLLHWEVKEAEKREEAEQQEADEEGQDTSES